MVAAISYDGDGDGSSTPLLIYEWRAERGSTSLRGVAGHPHFFLFTTSRVQNARTLQGACLFNRVWRYAERDEEELGVLCGRESGLVQKKAYIAYKMVTAAPKKSLLGLQDNSEKLIARIKKKHPISHNP